MEKHGALGSKASQLIASSQHIQKRQSYYPISVEAHKPQVTICMLVISTQPKFKGWTDTPEHETLTFILFQLSFSQ